MFSACLLFAIVGVGVRRLRCVGGGEHGRERSGTGGGAGGDVGGVPPRTRSQRRGLTSGVMSTVVDASRVRNGAIRGHSAVSRPSCREVQKRGDSRNSNSVLLLRERLPAHARARCAAGALRTRRAGACGNSLAAAAETAQTSAWPRAHPNSNCPGAAAPRPQRGLGVGHGRCPCLTLRR